MVSDLGGGFCHVLAYVLHERHGWPIRGLGRPADESRATVERHLRLARHMYCLNANGLPVDVHGVFSDEAAIRRFFTHPHRPNEPLVSVDVTPEDLTETLPDLGYRQFGDYELKLCREWADELRLDTLA